MRPSPAGIARDGPRINLTSLEAHLLDPWIWEKSQRLREITGFLGELKGVLVLQERHHRVVMLLRIITSSSL